MFTDVVSKLLRPDKHFIGGSPNAAIGCVRCGVVYYDIDQEVVLEKLGHRALAARD